MFLFVFDLNLVGITLRVEEDLISWFHFLHGKNLNFNRNVETFSIHYMPFNWHRVLSVANAAYFLNHFQSNVCSSSQFILDLSFYCSFSLIMVYISHLKDLSMSWSHPMLWIAFTLTQSLLHTVRFCIRVHGHTVYSKQLCTFCHWALIILFHLLQIIIQKYGPLGFLSHNDTCESIINLNN